MTYVAKTLAEVRQGDQVQLAIDERKHPPKKTGTWTGYDRDGVCVGDAVHDELTQACCAGNHYLWFTGTVAWKGTESLHVIPEGWEYKQGPQGYAIFADQVMEVDLDATSTFAAIIIDNRDGPEMDEQLALFPYPAGTVLMGPHGPLPLAVVGRDGMVHVIFDADGTPREDGAKDFDAALLDSEWGRLWRAHMVTPEATAEALDLIDQLLAIEEAE